MGDTAEQIPMLATETPQESIKRGPTLASNLRHRHRRLRLALNAKIGCGFHPWQSASNRWPETPIQIDVDVALTLVIAILVLLMGRLLI